MVPFRPLLAALALAFALPATGWADPPPHAPAHGHRAKHAKKPHPPERRGDVEIVFDSERGVHVAVGLPDVFFHAGRYYRRVGDAWQVSARADADDAGWTVIARGRVPTLIVGVHAEPAPAKLEVEPR